MKMYADLTNPPPAKKEQVKFDQQLRTISIKIDGKELFVPNIFFVERLETKIKEMERYNQELERRIDSLISMIESLQHQLNNLRR